MWGGQIGYYSVLAAKMGVEQIVYFDINDSFLRVGEKHALENDVVERVQFVSGAVGKDGETAEFQNFTGLIEREMFSLDSFCSATGLYPDLIKIDVEGFEVDVLEGASDLLLRKPVLLLSLHPELIRDRGKSDNRVFEILLSYDYKILLLVLEDKGEEVTSKKTDKFLKGPPCDFVCVPRGDDIVVELIKSLLSDIL